MWAVVYYSVRVRKSDREKARDLRRDAHITILIFSGINRTAMRKPGNKEGLLHFRKMYNGSNTSKIKHLPSSVITENV
jgi:hypothetical protein